MVGVNWHYRPAINVHIEKKKMFELDAIKDFAESSNADILVW